MKAIVLTIEEFDNKFTPVKNHLVKNAPFDETMFETFGKEKDFINEFAKANPRKVWTITAEEDEKMFFVSGIRLVNRVGYFITEEEFEVDTDIEVELPME